MPWSFIAETFIEAKRSFCFRPERSKRDRPRGHFNPKSPICIEHLNDLVASVLQMEALLGARTLLGAPGIATRSKDATRGSWHHY